jgi:hypothetical protein
MSDDGKTNMVVEMRDGKVILHFEKPMKDVIFDPQNAIDIACAITDAAFECRDGVKPVSDTLKAELVERHRRTLTNRAELILSSKREDRTMSHRKLAQELIEIFLKEVF